MCRHEKNIAGVEAQRIMPILRRTALALGVAVAAFGAASSASASAVPTVLSLEIFGDADIPTFQITNLTPDVGLIFFSVFIGDRSYNFDFASNAAVVVDTGATMLNELKVPFEINGGFRADFTTWHFLGFDTDDVFRFDVDIDPDSFDDTVDYRTIMFNNGTIRNAAVLARFTNGDRLLAALPDHGIRSSYSFRIPEPATLALFGFGLAGLGVMARRRRRA